MKKIMRVFIILFLCMVLIAGVFVTKVKANDIPEGFKKNAKFSEEGYKFKADYYVIDSSVKDLNGDRILDNVALVGQKKIGAKEDFGADLMLIIQDGKSKTFHYISPGSIVNGYHSKIFLGDFNGDKVNDVFIKIDGSNEGTSSFYSLITFKDNNPVELFNQENFSNGLKFDINLKDSYNAEIYCKETDKKNFVDVSHFCKRYEELGFCNAEGKVLREIRGEAGTYEELKPVDYNKDGTYELEGFQRISATPNKEIIAYAKSQWKFENSKMNLTNLNILPYRE